MKEKGESNLLEGTVAKRHTHILLTATVSPLVRVKKGRVQGANYISSLMPSWKGTPSKITCSVWVGGRTVLASW